MSRVESSLINQRIDYRQKEKLASDEHKKIMEDLKEKLIINKQKTQEAADEAIERVRLKSDERIVDQTKREEAQINTLKESTDKTRQLIEDELAKFKEMSEADRERFKFAHEERLGAMNENFVRSGQNMEVDFQKLMEDARNRNRSEITRQDLDFTGELTDRTRLNASRLDTLDGNFKNRYVNNEVKFNQAIIEQEKQGMKEVEQMQRDYKLQKENVKTLNEDEIAKRKQYYQNTLETIKKEFEKNFNERQEYQRKFLADLEKAHKEEIRKTIDDYSFKKSYAISKLGDQFYRAQLLDPKISENKKEYIIELKVPEHEKGLVQISGADRLIKLTMSREHADEVVAADGTKARNQKFETFSKELNVPEIIDARKVTRTWKDGVLTFVMPKK